MHIVYIGIGSNIANRETTIARALDLLRSHQNIEVVSQSKLYEYPALTVDDKPQTDYLNGIVEIRTTLEPLELLDVLQSIERELGRPENHARWQPRTIDLDILLYDDLVMDMPRLTLPHPELHKRMFVLQPLCDIAPKLSHPVLGSNIASLLKTF